LTPSLPDERLLPTSETFNPGPCIETNFASATLFCYFSSNLTSTGTYSANGMGNAGTLQISQEITPVPVPEPSAFLLTGFVLLVGLWVARKQAFCHAARY
jgi:hypothetical protein